MLRKSTIILLRIPFSFFLMPVYFFALSQAPDIHYGKAALVFVILHLFLYPASNGYNSYMDRDTGSIGMLRHPPPAHKELFYVSLGLDVAALVLSIAVGPVFTLCILANILASRAYSYRGIRLKRFPVIGFLTVITFQGALTYFMVFNGASEAFAGASGVFAASSANIPEAFAASPAGTEILFPWQGMLISSLLFGSLYPLTQVYQHRQDLEDGVKTISYMLGYMGTFIFSGILYLLAEVVLFYYFGNSSRPQHFWLLQLFFLPVMCYFFYWWYKVWKDKANASFGYAMRMNTIAAVCTNAAFILLCFQGYFPGA